MRKKSNIVSFDEARRSSQRRNPPRSSQAQSREEADSNKLSMIFELDFGNENAEPASFDSANTRSSRSRKASGIRAAVETYDPRGEDPDNSSSSNHKGSNSKTSFFESRQQKRRQKTKARAEKQFNKTYGGSGNLPNGNSTDTAGPRAAVYSGEMGAKQRLATRMQDREQRTGVSFSFPILNKMPTLPKTSKPLTITLGVLLSVTLLVCMIYTPAQQYYHQLRERDRLSAEYSAVLARNDALQSAVDYLQTEEGIEDKAHSEFGLIKEGEQAGSVSGIDVQNNSKFTANVAPGSIPAPETWYSPVLDVIFFYSS